MAEVKLKVVRLPVDSALIPVYYQNFRCLMGNCRDNCCEHNWIIVFNKKDYLRLRRLDAPPELQELLKREVRREKKGDHDGIMYAKFDLNSNNGRCPFLNTEGMCSIQRACGGDVLPEVCKTYPRKFHYTPAAKEYTLSPSCEGVLQQLWDLPEGVEFVEDPLPKAEQRDVSIVRNENLLRYFAPLRELFIDILQNRAMSLTERMLYLGVTIQRLQKEDWENFDPDSWVEQAMLLAGTDTVREMVRSLPGNRRMFLMQNLNVLSEIAAEGKSWTSKISGALKVRKRITVSSNANDEADRSTSVEFDFSTNAYADALAGFQAAFGDREYFFENLMVASALYMVFPNLDSKEDLWKSFISLCNLYSFFRFVSVLGCKEDATKERLFHMIVMASRATLHNRDRFNGFQEKLFRNDSSTLAHMAILLRWD